MEANCERCGTEFEYSKKDTRIDVRGYMYYTRLVKCPNCGHSIIVEYIDEPNRSHWGDRGRK